MSSLELCAEPKAPFSKADSLRMVLVDELPGLRAHALKLCRTRRKADDLVHDTVERALRFEHTYEPGTNARAWLHQILFSVFVTSCRRLRRERVALELLGQDPCAWTRPESEQPRVTLSAPLRRAMSRLPESYRAVLELVDVQDNSYKEAATMLDIPVGTVMSRLFRGRKQLAAALELAPQANAA